MKRRHRKATSAHIKELHDAILRLHGVESAHVRSVHVTEKYQGQIVWDGDVEVFKLTGHPQADQAFAWAHEADKPTQKRFVAVLKVAPVTSPKLAVRAAIIQEHRGNAAQKS